MLSCDRLETEKKSLFIIIIYRYCKWNWPFTFFNELINKREIYFIHSYQCYTVWQPEENYCLGGVYHQHEVISKSSGLLRSWQIFLFQSIYKEKKKFRKTDIILYKFILFTYVYFLWLWYFSCCWCYYHSWLLWSKITKMFLHNKFSLWILKIFLLGTKLACFWW